MDNFVDKFAEGALYTETCLCHAGGCPYEETKNVKVFEIAAIQAKITYNEYGWHDPQGGSLY